MNPSTLPTHAGSVQRTEVKAVENWRWFPKRWKMPSPPGRPGADVGQPETDDVGSPGLIGRSFEARAKVP